MIGILVLTHGQFGDDLIKTVEAITHENEAVAALNISRRLDFETLRSRVLETIKNLNAEFRLAVIDGDIATSLDAERAEKAGALSVQINTGGQCHLDAGMIQSALAALPLDQVDLLIVENVGNLVCPASFKLGTHKNILVASIPEGDDKPYKYPGMYQGTDILIINKIDLLPYIPFRMEFFQAGVQALNPGVRTFPLSCLKGEGMESWIGWLKKEVLQLQKRKGVKDQR